MSQGFYGFPNVLGLLRGTNLKVLGKAGATAGAGLAGGTTSGAPTSGQFDVGEAVFGQDGSLWICTVAGSPGTFVQAGFANPLSTKADLIVGGTAGAASRLGVGSDNQVLTADSSQTLGVKWAVTSANAGGALTQIAASTLSSSATDITFSGIAGSYSSLDLAIQSRGDVAATQTNLHVQVNADTGSNYDWEFMQVNGTAGGIATSEGRATTSLVVGYTTGSTAPASTADGARLFLPNYAGTTFHKSFRTLSSLKLGTSTGNIYIVEAAGWWRSTSAITSIKVYPESGNFVAGTSAQLYGLS